MADAFDISKPGNLNRGFLWRLKNDETASEEEAKEFIKGFKFSVFIDPEEANNPAYQACLLTIVNTALRISGEPNSVQVFGVENQKRNDNSGLNGSLEGAVRGIGGVCKKVHEGHETLGIVIGNATPTFECRFFIRAIFSGWRGGIVPYKPAERFDCPPSKIPLGAILAASLSIYECFRCHNDEGGAVGHIPVGMSLWDLTKEDWLSPDETEPQCIENMPPLWFCGLGHLGQAYLWALGHLPLSEKGKANLKVTIQDNDEAGDSNLSTSLLVNEGNLGDAKTAISRDWLQNRGFEAVETVNALLTPDSKIEFGDSNVLCGFDNIKARRQAAFRKPVLLIDGGLGARTESFQCIEVTVFPSDIDLENRWPDIGKPRGESSRVIESHFENDECGLETITEIAVGFPFVGVMTAAIVIAELLRRNASGPKYSSISINMKDLENRRFKVPS